MTIRNLSSVFTPHSVALIGASPRDGSIGAVLARNLLTGGFQGDVGFVNPKYDQIADRPCYRSVAELPFVPDLAVISTPPDPIPDLVGELAERGTRGVVIITAGFADSGTDQGRALQQRVLDRARPHLVRVVGPNCVGILVPGIGLNASFAHLTPAPGGIAFVAQSGAVVTAVLDWAAPRDIGFSHLVSLGNMADADFGDMLDFLADDPRTTGILLYIEAITHARKFMSAARAAARTKPVIAVKAGRGSHGARAASSHTGALAGNDAAYDAAFRRAGILRVYTLAELFYAVETLATMHRPHGDRLAIVTNGGGLGVLATDALVQRGGQLAKLAPETVTALNAILPPTWSHDNPVDLVGDASGQRYADALRALALDPGIDAILVINCPTAVISRTEAAQAVIDAAPHMGQRPLLTCWVGSATADPSRRMFAASSIPTFGTPEQAIRAFMHLIDYGVAQELLLETPPSWPEAFETSPAAARAVISEALKSGREWLTEPEAKTVLSHYAIPIVPTKQVTSGAQAASEAANLGGPVVLKVLSEDITHKSDVGGVVLNLEGPSAVHHAVQQMTVRIRETYPDAHISGFTVQPMVRRPGASELIVGVANDPTFGPLITFGHGGIAVEVIGDHAIGLPPLNMRLAREMIGRTRIARLLAGYRNVRPSNVDAIALTLIKIAQLVIDLPEVVELDVNPLLADEYGVLALDARMRVHDASGLGDTRLAIRPYPAELEENVPVGDGRVLLLRPIRPEDEPPLQEAFASLTPDEVRSRFFVPMKTFTHMLTARFTQIDYDRDMVLVLTEPGLPGKTVILGVVQINADPDGERAEYAILLRREMTGKGLGMFLMRRILDYAARRGIKHIYGDVLSDNRPMLHLCERLGFTAQAVADDPGLTRVRLAL